MTPQEFVHKWKKATLSERSAAQQHFLDICNLIGHPTPADLDSTGESFTFEKGTDKTTGKKGFADVWKRGFFGWEYKGKRRNLADAYQQLLKYREALANPPLLVVCDLDRFEVHTNFTGTVKQVYAFDLDGLLDPKNVDVLRAAFTDPDKLRPGRTQKQVTEEIADKFATLAYGMRDRKLPLSVFHFDCRWMREHHWCDFEWDLAKFPDPKGMLARIKARGLKVCVWINPYISELSSLFAEGRDHGYFLKDSAGNVYQRPTNCSTSAPTLKYSPSSCCNCRPDTGRCCKVPAKYTSDSSCTPSPSRCRRSRRADCPSPAIESTAGRKRFLRSASYCSASRCFFQPW